MPIYYFTNMFHNHITIRFKQYFTKSFLISRLLLLENNFFCSLHNYLVKSLRRTKSHFINKNVQKLGIKVLTHILRYFIMAKST